jgi:hypothetical protein
MRRMNGTSDINTTPFQRAAVVRRNGARIAAQVVKEAQQAYLRMGENYASRRKVGKDESMEETRQL